MSSSAVVVATSCLAVPARTFWTVAAATTNSPAVAVRTPSFSASAWGHDVVSDFRDGTDRLNFHDAGVAGLQDLSLAAVGSNALIAWHGNEVLLIGVRVADLGPADFIF
jgi:hypothetical protein